MDTMTTYEKIKDSVEKYPRARERRFKDEAIVHMLWQSHALDISGVSKTLLCALFHEYSTYDRLWRQVMQENPNLRGKDYSEEKKRLEQEKMIELGYEVGFNEDIKHGRIL